MHPHLLQQEPPPTTASAAFSSPLCLVSDMQNDRSPKLISFAFSRRLGFPAKLVFLSALAFFWAFPGFSQSPSSTLPAQDQTQFPITLYQKAIGIDAPLYNGPEYVDYRKAIRDWHQYYEKDVATPATVWYDGGVYENVPMLYDAYLDEAIIMREGTLKQKLISEKVKGFSLGGHTFLRIVVPDSLSGAPLRTGYYDVLLDQNVKMLVKRRKTIKMEKEPNLILEKFVLDEQFFLKNKGQYVKVKSRNSVLDVFEDKKKELKQFAREKKLNFRKQREQAILALATHYETLGR
jgi:hypothetical protein